MVERVLDRLEKVLIDINFFQEKIKKESSLDNSISLLYEFGAFVYLNKSNLFLLNQLVFEFRKAKPTYIEQNVLLIEARNLVQKHLHSDILDVTRNKIEKSSHTGKIDLKIEPLKYKTSVPEYAKLRSKDFDNSIQVRRYHKKLQNQTYMYLDLMFFFNFEILESENHIEFSDSEIRFFDSMYYGRPTLETWSKFPNTDFLDYFSSHSNEFLAVVNKVQQKLFNEALKIELTQLVEAIQRGNRLFNINLYLNLIEKFINSSASELEIKRLFGFIKCDNPDEVIVAIDKILREEPTDYRLLLPYDGPYKKKSPKLLAHIFLQFGTDLSKILLNYTSTRSGLELNDVYYTFSKKYVPKTKTISFNYVHGKAKTVQLKSILSKLDSKFTLIEPNKMKMEQFVEVLICKDFTKLDYKIYIGCKTSLFCYILKQLKPFFQKLNSRTIEESELFITKDNLTLLKASNFNKREGFDVQYKEEIRKIVAQLK